MVPAVGAATIVARSFESDVMSTRVDLRYVSFYIQPMYTLYARYVLSFDVATECSSKQYKRRCWMSQDSPHLSSQTECHHQNKSLNQRTAKKMTIYKRDFTASGALTGPTSCNRFMSGSYSGSAVTVALIRRPKYSISTPVPSAMFPGNQA